MRHCCKVASLPWSERSVGGEGVRSDSDMLHKPAPDASGRRGQIASRCRPCQTVALWANRRQPGQTGHGGDMGFPRQHGSVAQLAVRQGRRKGRAVDLAHRHHHPAGRRFESGHSPSPCTMRAMHGGPLHHADRGDSWTHRPPSHPAREGQRCMYL